MTTTRIPNGQYSKWLCSQFAVEGPNPEKTYDDLFEILHNKEFVWIVPNDDNRIKDAQELRFEYWSKRGERQLAPVDTGVSVLEMIVALSRRCAFNGGGEADVWAWGLIENLGLGRMTDPISKRRRATIDDILEALIWRTYQRNGAGGLFPLVNPKEDQTQVELWYQMHAYILEHDLI